MNYVKVFFNITLLLIGYQWVFVPVQKELKQG